MPRIVVECIAGIGKAGYDSGMDENTFECPNCGARIYPEMLRCPQCGQIMYPEDEAEPAPEAESSSARWVGALGATIIGWIAASGVALLLQIIVAVLKNSSEIGWFASSVLFMSGPLGALTGGYLCALVARQHQRLLGGIVGIMLLPILVLLTTHWYEVTLDLLLKPVMLLAGGLSIAAGLAGGWLNLVITNSTGWKDRWKVRGWEDMLYQDLLRRARFNGSIADRLIEYERQQDPSATRLKLIQNAIERWERDNR